MNLSDLDEPTERELLRIEKEMAVFDRDVPEKVTRYSGPSLDGDWVFTYKPEPDVRWMKRAACRGMGPDLFFPDPKDGTTSVEAKKVCARCPVQQQCADYAIDHFEDHGVWGGLTEKGLRAARKVRRAQKSAGRTAA